MIDYQEVEDLLTILSRMTDGHLVGWCEQSGCDPDDFTPEEYAELCDCGYPELHSRVQKAIKDLRETKIWSEMDLGS